MVGADEFVIDSYKIHEGKFSILAMEGKSLLPLNPDLLEFWQGRENRLHDRFQYTRLKSGWSIDRLAP